MLSGACKYSTAPHQSCGAMLHHCTAFGVFLMSQDEAKHGSGTNDLAAIGKFIDAIEILSSETSSDDGIRAYIKAAKQKTQKHSSTKIRKTSARGHPPPPHTESPLMSRASSHQLNYSYEEDTCSLGGRSHSHGTPFSKLMWPGDERVKVGGTLQKGGSSTVPSYKETVKQTKRKQNEGSISPVEGDESNEEDGEGNPVDPETDGEDMPVLPKVPVKRKLLNESKGGERRTQRGRPKNTSPQMKKQKTPQIDASVITQLQFGRRPPNSVSNAPLCM